MSLGMSKGTSGRGVVDGGRRGRIALLAAGALGAAAALAGVAGWLGGSDPAAKQPVRAETARLRPREVASARATRPPRFLAGSGPLDRPMPAALARDLARFDDGQLRAELESLVLSFPEVQVVEASCRALPCQAQVVSADAGALARYAEAVGRRFKGFLRTEVAPEPGRPSVQRARFEIGTSYR